jgi:hypothetical protein
MFFTVVIVMLVICVVSVGEGEWKEQEIEAMEEFIRRFGVFMEGFQREPQSSIRGIGFFTTG